MRPKLEDMKRDIRITNIAEEMGFSLVRKGRYYSLKEHDSVIIDDEKNCYWQNSIPGEGRSIGKGGSVLDFISTFGDMSIKETVHYLEGRYTQNKWNSLHQEVFSERKLNHLRLPPKDKNMKKVFAYLCQTRKILPEVVEMMVKNKQLYQDKKGNCVFVSFDEEKPTYGMVRGTNTYHRFIGDCQGNDYSKGFFVDNHANKLIITESVIDAMSLMSLTKEKNGDYKDYDYLVLGGVGKLDSLEYRFLKKSYIGTILSLDNDEAGHSAGEMIKNHLRRLKPQALVMDFYPKQKDWNEELIQYREKELIKNPELGLER